MKSWMVEEKEKHSPFFPSSSSNEALARTSLKKNKLRRYFAWLTLLSNFDRVLRGPKSCCAFSTNLRAIGSFSSAPLSRKTFSFIRHATVATIDESVTANNDEDKQRIVGLLQKKTVKELREMIKNITPSPPRGIMSKLKLKHDIVLFLAEHALSVAKVDKDRKEKKDHLKPKKKVRASMPPIISSSDHISTETSKSYKSKKDRIYEEVMLRYPGLNETTPRKLYDHDMENDVRTKYHPILVDAPQTSDMDIGFIGTASCTPGITRGVSCTALRLNWRRSTETLMNSIVAKVGVQNNGSKKEKHFQYDFSGGTWVFDCGECTQLQLQKSTSLKAGKITKIFITHCHGDHSFGLPGLLCLMGQDSTRGRRPDENGEFAPPIEIYGPEGLRSWLRVAIRYSNSRIVPNYRVHELKNVPMAPEWKMVRDNKSGRCRYFYDWNRVRKSENREWMNEWGYQGIAGEDPFAWITQCARDDLIERDPMFGEIPGGRDIYPDYEHPLCSNGAPIWEVENEGDVMVRAAPMSHGVPCVGYAVEEQSKPGRLRPESIVPVIKRNTAALKEAGVTAPMKVMAVIKNLPVDGSFTFPDGTVITQSDAVEPPRKGRKVVICGDTVDSRAMENLARDANVVVHEATNSYLEGMDVGENEFTVTRDTMIHGHSTPRIAGDFARRVRAKKLILNHFSSRYNGDESLDSIVCMTRIEKQAIQASALPEDCVCAAWDFMLYPIKSN